MKRGEEQDALEGIGARLDGAAWLRVLCDASEDELALLLVFLERLLGLHVLLDTCTYICSRAWAAHTCSSSTLAASGSASDARAITVERTMTKQNGRSARNGTKLRARSRQVALRSHELVRSAQSVQENSAGTGKVPAFTKEADPRRMSDMSLSSKQRRVQRL